MSKITREPSRFTRVARSKDEPNTTIIGEKNIIQNSKLGSQANARPRSKILPMPNISSKIPIKAEPSYFEYLPNDTKYDILANMTCEELLDTKRNNPQLSNLITPEYFTRFLNKGYPRLTGRAQVFTFNAKDFIDQHYMKIVNLSTKLNSILPRSSIAISVRSKLIKLPTFSAQDQVDLEAFLSTNYSNLKLDINVRSNKIKIKEALALKEALAQEIDNVIVDNIKNSNKFRRMVINGDIVKGDIIFVTGEDYKNRYYIFNGCNLFEIDQTESFPLDGEFQVIKDNIPIKYWFDTGNEELDKMLTSSEEDAYYSVNFDHRPYRGKLIKNLQAVQYGNNGNMYKIESSFQANGKNYVVDIDYIVYFMDKDIIPEIIDNFVRLFEQQKFYIPFTTTKDENTLYLPKVYEEQKEKLFYTPK